MSIGQLMILAGAIADLAVLIWFGRSVRKLKRTIAERNLEIHRLEFTLDEKQEELDKVKS